MSTIRLSLHDGGAWRDLDPSTTVYIPGVGGTPVALSTVPVGDQCAWTDPGTLEVWSTAVVAYDGAHNALLTAPPTGMAPRGRIFVLPSGTVMTQGGWHCEVCRWRDVGSVIQNPQPADALLVDLPALGMNNDAALWQVVVGTQFPGVGVTYAYTGSSGWVYGVGIIL